MPGFIIMSIEPFAYSLSSSVLQLEFASGLKKVLLKDAISQFKRPHETAKSLICAQHYLLDEAS